MYRSSRALAEVLQHPTPETSEPKKHSSSGSPKHDPSSMRERVEGAFELDEPRHARSVRHEYSQPVKRLKPPTFSAAGIFHHSRDGYSSGRPPTEHASAALVAEKSSSTAEEPSLLRRVRDDVCQVSLTLHEKGITGLEQVSHDLTGAAAKISQDDAAFIRAAAGWREKLAQSPSAYTMKKTIDHRDGTQTVETCTVGENVAEVRKRLVAAETEIAELWAKWEAADAEYEAAVQALLCPGTGKGTDDGAMQLPMQRHMSAFKEELEALATQSLERMWDSEKDYKKAISADMHTYISHLMADDS